MRPLDRYVVSIALSALTFGTHPTLAADSVESAPAQAEEKRGNGVAEFVAAVLVVETGVALVSRIAAEDALAYGTVFVVASPSVIAFADAKQRKQSYAAFAVMAGIGAYNISLADESEDRAFRHNMILYNGLLACSLVYSLIKEKRAEERAGNEVVTAPLADGAVIFWARRF